MSPTSDEPADEALRFHQLVAEGRLEELQAAIQTGAAVDAPGDLGQTALMIALRTRDLEKVQLLIQHGADPELTDDLNATALRHAVEADFADGVRYLIGLGVDRGFHPRDPLKKIDYSRMFSEATPMPEDLGASMTEADWKRSQEETLQLLEEFGQNPTVGPMIADVQSVEVLKFFLDAGDDLNLAPAEVRRAHMGLETGGELRVGLKDYRRQKSPRYGTRNPERMDFPFWKDMIRTGGNAYTARSTYDDADPFTKPGVVWCYERFGSSVTPLSDGRFVQIGGEHEDYYDPDFYIYNDVVIHDGHGDCQVYGYPKHVFPPTDFHSATLCPDGIYVIGCLGYMDQRRAGFTPVYRLHLETWRIEPLVTQGEAPGWIHRHRARYDCDRNVICLEGGQVHTVVGGEEPQLVPNEQRFELDLARLEWRQVN